MPVLQTAGRFARWVAPSAVAACAGAIAAGLVEGIPADGAYELAAIVGFLALVVVPVLLLGGLLVRALAFGWQPRTLAIVEPDGAAPRLAGWIAVLVLATLALAAIVYRGTWMLAGSTDFKPLGVGFAEPVIALAGATVLFAASRPAARAFTALARQLDARWRRSGRTTLLRPRTVIASTLALAVLATAFAWFVVVKPRLGPIDTSVLHAPALALAIALVVHRVWARIRTVVAVACAVLAAGAITAALAARASSPSLTLEIWGERPLAGLAIDQLFDLEDIRAGISLAEFRPVDRPGAAHPDIILVTIDTMRADHTPPYGGAADMPVLRQLAEHGTVFTWAFAPSNVTRRSLPSIVIGLAPNRIRGRVVGWGLRVDPRHVLLAERLRAGGYETAGFMSLPNFFNDEGRTGMQRGIEYLEIEQNGHKLSRLGAQWLVARKQRGERRPLFLWMHILEPHNWTAGYGVPRNDVDRKTYYDRSLAAADTMLRTLLAPFADRPPDRAPIVIVTADHGEALGEHGHDYHSTDLYNSQMRVPLVIVGPGIRAQTIGETVSLIDLVPTIVELAGFQPPVGVDGRSIADLATGRRAGVPETGTAFAAMIKDRSNPGGVTAFVDGRWKIIDADGALELYDIVADPDERTDLANHQPDVLRRLQTGLAAKQAAGSESPFR